MLNRHRVNRRGEVIADKRRPVDEWNSNEWQGGPIYGPRHSSRARAKYKAARAARRANTGGKK